MTSENRPVLRCEQCEHDLFVEVVAWRLLQDVGGVHRMQEVRFFRCAECERTLRHEKVA